MSLRWTYAGRSHIGRVRDLNEDAWLAEPAFGAFAVTDGMGGHAAGEVAARMAVEALSERLAALTADATAAAAYDALEEGILAANRAILEEAERDPRKRGMGTTVTALMLLPAGQWALGHVGDSRAYLLRDGGCRRLTEDHTVVQELVRKGHLTSEQARVHPRASVLTRALGVEPKVPVDKRGGQLLAGDRFLLCSDGLTAMLSEGRLAALAGANGTAETVTERLVEAALAAGGADNVTVVVVDVEAEEPA